MFFSLFWFFGQSAKKKRFFFEKKSAHKVSQFLGFDSPPRFSLLSSLSSLSLSSSSSQKVLKRAKNNNRERRVVVVSESERRGNTKKKQHERCSKGNHSRARARLIFCDISLVSCRVVSFFREEEEARVFFLLTLPALTLFSLSLSLSLSFVFGKKHANNKRTHRERC